MHSDTQIVALFVWIQNSLSIVLDSQPHLHYSHQDDIQDRLMDFISSNSYTRTLRHNEGLATCVYTS